MQDFARRQHGDVKHHEPTPQARVVRLFPDESCGFLATEDGREVYFHKDSVLGAGFKRLRVGTLAAFVEEQGEKGPQASTVRILGKQGSRREARKALAATG